MTPTDPDLRLLRMFDAIYAQRHVTRAAEMLGIGQPTLSIGLKQLRGHFADPLFVKTGQGMLPTPRADQLIGAVRDILQRVGALSAGRGAFDPATARRVFRIAMTDASHITLLPRLLAAVQRSAPGIVLEATRIDDGLAAALETGETALALGLIPQLDAGFYQQGLYEQDFICLARPAHPDIAGRLDTAVYRAARHIAIVSGTGQMLIEDTLRQAGIDRKVALRLPGFLGLSAIVAASDLIVTLPRHIGETLADLGRLAVHECPFAIPRFTVKQHWHARYHADPSNCWLRQLTAELFGAL